MTTHIRSERVTFLHTFVLKALEGVQPAGTYSVETHEECSRFLPFVGTNRRSTWIRVCRNPGIGGVLQVVNINPLDLAAALMRDRDWLQLAGT